MPTRQGDPSRCGPAARASPPRLARAWIAPPSWQIVATLSATVSQVSVVTALNAAGNVVPVQATFGETTLTLIKSLAASQSASTATNALPTAAIGLSQP